jgi:hypothetical protein
MRARWISKFRNYYSPRHCSGCRRAATALAQSSVSNETTTISTGTVQAPVVAETMKKKVYRQETNMPGAEGGSESRSEKQVTSDAIGHTWETARTEHPAQLNGIDGSHSESSSTTGKAIPN